MKSGRRLVVEDRIGRGRARLPANPCLDGIETLGSLVDIVEIRDVVDRGQELRDAIVALSNRNAPRGTAVQIAFPFMYQPEPTGHHRPRLPAKHSLTMSPLTYAKLRDRQTTNTQVGEMIHNIFDPSKVEE